MIEIVKLVRKEDLEILIMYEPTRGCNVGAKFQICSLIVNLANMSTFIIISSSEIEEIICIYNRALVKKKLQHAPQPYSSLSKNYYFNNTQQQTRPYYNMVWFVVVYYYQCFNLLLNISIKIPKIFPSLILFPKEYLPFN